MSTIRLFTISIISLLFQSTYASKGYEAIKVEMATKREFYQKLYNESTAVTAKEKTILQAQDYLFKTIIEELFPHWYGTPWDFNGTTQIPKKGKIACGYFVTTILRDAGFDIPRIKWAQMASETMIKRVTKNIKRFSNAKIETIEDYIHQKGDGLYIVGLDSHVGFVYKSGQIIRFVHANYYQRQKGVMSESIHTKNPLKDSKYRVIGKILHKVMVTNWILKKKYE